MRLLVHMTPVIPYYILLTSFWKNELIFLFCSFLQWVLKPEMHNHIWVENNLVLQFIFQKLFAVQWLMILNIFFLKSKISKDFQFFKTDFYIA